MALECMLAEGGLSFCKLYDYLATSEEMYIL